MSEVKTGDTVEVHYVGKLEDGTVFDSSPKDQPLRFTIGQGRIIPGFEQAVVGMEEEDTKTVTLKPDEAYGERRDDLVKTFDRSNLPESITPSVGQQLQMKRADGGVINVTVTDFDEENVTIDANHPLAGKTLVFDIELVNKV
ncbi:MAG: peptidylprolyl isomerase [candidate division Zixibacteria bacterium]|nr:peptidylprolyl isomerase [candidate division Zixibacteria bacterium]